MKKHVQLVAGEFSLGCESTGRLERGLKGTEMAAEETVRVHGSSRQCARLYGDTEHHEPSDISSDERQEAVDGVCAVMVDEAVSGQLLYALYVCTNN